MNDGVGNKFKTLLGDGVIETSENCSKLMDEFLSAGDGNGVSSLEELIAFLAQFDVNGKDTFSGGSACC